jgi:dTDP-4-amino-4,6-dideoxygalactose transaminase
VPVHLSGAYGSDGCGFGSTPVAEAAAGQILSLPLYPHITVEQQERVVESLALAMGGG